MPHRSIRARARVPRHFLSRVLGRTPADSAVTGIKDALNDDGSIKPQSVDYSKVVPVLVKAIQEQQTQIEQLKQQLNK